MATKLHVTFKPNPAIVLVPTSNEPSPTAAVTFRSNGAIDLGASIVAPLVQRPVTFKTNVAIVFSSTASGRVGGGALRWIG